MFEDLRWPTPRQEKTVHSGPSVFVQVNSKIEIIRDFFRHGKSARVISVKIYEKRFEVNNGELWTVISARSADISMILRKETPMAP